MDDIDEKLIAFLRRDARMPIAKLATELGLGRAAVSARMDKLRREGVITGFTVLTRGDTAPLPISGVTLVEISGRNTADIIARLDRLPEVRTIHTTNGRWDLVCEIGTWTLEELDALLRRIRLIPGVANSETSLYLTTKRARGRAATGDPA